MSSFSDSVFDKIYLLAVEWGCLLFGYSDFRDCQKGESAGK